MSRYVGLLICLLIIIGAISHVGLNYYNDILSFSFVAGGGVGYGLLKGQNDKFLINCCKQHIGSNYGYESKEMKTFKIAVSGK